MDVAGPLIDDWRDIVSSHVRTSSVPLLAILGPTASGKTDLSLQVATFIQETVHEHGWEGAEIVNADSRQLYRGMDIGTAKITKEEMRGIPHHLLDLLDPNEDLSVAWYKERAEEAIDDILSRKCVPLLVGGSMLYVSSVIDGIIPLPKADEDLRRSLEEKYDEDEGHALYAHLEEHDPETAKTFHRRNKPYVVRASELLAMTGMRPSQMKKAEPPRYKSLLIGLLWEREALLTRIEARTGHLLDAGWVQEVERLLDQGYVPGDPGMKSHGYREITAWLQSEEQSREELVEAINRKTRQYAKRQMTWWKNDERIRWMAMPVKT